jgi:murein L,D-transpeptidase YafK
MRVLALFMLPALLAVAGAGRCDVSAGGGSDSRVAVAVPAGGAGAGAAGEGSSARLPAPSFSASLPIADQVIVRKSERRLYLMRGGKVLRSYRVALGLMPAGAKERAGDFRTPEGRYLLTRRNSHSDYFLSIQVSYPNDEDLRRARRQHVDPGGSIMIHGLPNSLRHPPDYYATSDWTDGCIAMSDSDMVELWLLTQDNIPIDIQP